MTVTAKYLPAPLDIEFVKGDDVNIPVLILNRNLEGGTGNAEVRVKEDDTSTLVATLTVTLTDDGANTQVVIGLASANNVGPTGKWYWDMEITLLGEKRTYLAGRCTIHEDVTA